MPRIQRLLVLSLSLLAAACATEPELARHPCPSPYVEADPGRTAIVRLPMRDCATLVTSVHFPEGAGPWPVILVRTPYGRGEEGMMPIDGAKLQFVPRGYVVVSQDVRGRFGSDGEFTVWQYEGVDGADTLAWIERQPWFNGRVGVWGASYIGFTALAAATARPDLVQAIVVQVTQSDFYRAAYEHGLIRADTSGSWLLGMRERDSFSLVDEATRERAVLEFPLTEGDLRTVGPQTLDDDFLVHGTSDDWYRIALGPSDFRALDTPMYMAGGWFDFMVAGQLADWDALVERRDGRDLQLVLGPWTHVMGSATPMNFRSPTAATSGSTSDVRPIFRPLPARRRPGRSRSDARALVRRGLGAWREGGRIWPAEAREVVWNAAEATGAVGCAPEGTLSPSPATRETTADWSYDPHEAIRLNGGQLIDFGLWGMRREIDWCAEAAAVFETAPLAESLEIAGAIAVDLRVASDAPDTAFFARLYLVDNDGVAYNLREGASLLSHREGDAAKVSYTPGQRVTLTIPMAPLRWTLQPGQRLGLAVASSGYPLIVPHTNVAGPDWVAVRDPEPAQQTLIAGRGAEATRLRIEAR